MSNWYCYFTHLLQELVSTKINNQNLGKDVQNILLHMSIYRKKSLFFSFFNTSPVPGDVTYETHFCVSAALNRIQRDYCRDISLIPLILSIYRASPNSHLFDGQVLELR